VVRGLSGRVQAVLLDAGGVVVLPRRELVADALARAGIHIEPSAVPEAHYRAVRALDRRPELSRGRDPYPRALCSALGVSEEHVATATRELAATAAGEQVLWSEQTQEAFGAIAALRDAGLGVAIVTNSDGHAAENLQRAGLDPRIPVVDSALVGVAKPDPRIFAHALERLRVPAATALHVGDTLTSDVAGARAAGIEPLHFDPTRRCRTRDHRHVRSLRGIWRHLAR
jgi:putative hydrolase of the HAD superfamily